MVENMDQHFSIEIKSKKLIKKLVINDNNQGILIEGNHGEYVTFSILEDRLLEIIYTEGVLRLEIDPKMNIFLPYMSLT
jgi:hypothetical protein